MTAPLTDQTATTGRPPRLVAMAAREITKQDTHPQTGKTDKFTFPKKMIADPLTDNGDLGSVPDNTALWWPLFQQRHKNGGIFWVQGHMLNHLVHGPGKPHNLVPISNILNTNMEALIEHIVKELVQQGSTHLS